MSKQIVNIIEFSTLYNILHEIRETLSFKIINYNKIVNFLKEKDRLDLDSINSIYVLNSNDKQHELKKIDKRNILILDNLPLEINKIVDKINTQLIKQKYNYQSKIILKKYTIDLNARNIFKDQKKLKLTEREIDIIIFLNNHEQPQPINTLQNKVWGYSSELETHTVETHIYRLRKKIKEEFSDENFILSNKDGYSI